MGTHIRSSAAPLVLALAFVWGSPAQVVLTGLTEDEKKVVEGMITSTQAVWDQKMPKMVAVAEARPKETIAYLVSRLDDGTDVYGLPFESQIYSVCGNALTLLERLTLMHVCRQESRWRGFATHDHRGAKPSEAEISHPWRAWLHRRADLPTDRWFWGLSLRELKALRTPLRTARTKWNDALLADAKKLGRRAYPALLAMLLENNWGADERQLCEQANDLLAVLTGEDPVPMPMINPLKYRGGSPMRGPQGTERNRAARRLAQQTWINRLIVGK